MELILKKRIFIFLSITLILFACKTIRVRDKETTGNVLFKTLLKKSEKINDVYISGLFKINGVKELPPIYLQFESQGKLKEKAISFRILSFKTPIIDISLNQNDVLFINHAGEEFVNLDIEQIDFSKFTGISFNPLDLSYFFLGTIPYSESMELMDFKWTKKEYIIDISDNVSKYTIHLNSKEELGSIKIFNQYFDALFLESIKYKKNNDGINMPYMLVFSSEDKKIQISFIINKILLDPLEKSLIDLDILNKYKEVSTLEKMQMKFKKNK